MTLEYTNLLHSKALKIYPNWEFRFQNIPSGYPDLWSIGVNVTNFQKIAKIGSIMYSKTTASRLDNYVVILERESYFVD
jgi:hypothetical protein